MFSQFAFILKIRIKQAFPLLVHMRFLFSFIGLTHCAKNLIGVGTILNSALEYLVV